MTSNIYDAESSRAFRSLKLDLWTEYLSTRKYQKQHLLSKQPPLFDANTLP